MAGPGFFPDVDEFFPTAVWLFPGATACAPRSDHPNAITTTIAEFLAKEINAEQMKEAVAARQALTDYEEAGVLGELLSRLPDLRKYTKRFITLPFKAAKGSELLMEAVQQLRQRHQESSQLLQKDIIQEFLSADWQVFYDKQDQQCQQTIGELAIYLAVKKH